MVSARSLRFRLNGLIARAVLCFTALATAAAWGLRTTHRGDARVANEVRERLHTAQLGFEQLITAEHLLHSILRLKDPDEIEHGLTTYQQALNNLSLALTRADAKFAERGQRLHATSEVVTGAVLLGDNVAALEAYMRQFAPEVEAIGRDLREYSQQVSSSAEAEIAARDRAISRAIVRSAVIVALLVLAISLAGWLLQRKITRSLSQTSDSLNRAAESLAQRSLEVASGSQTVADGTSTQAAALEEAGASSTELLSLSESANKHMSEAAREVSEARTLCANSESGVTQLTTAMQELATASRGVEKIIKSIDEIAFQTNILALNAAVEAARAGEAGAGFAVVAEDVRALAKRSADAARETAGPINAAISATERGGRISADVAKQLMEISSRVRRLDEIVGGLAKSAQEQMGGIRHIGDAMSKIDEVAQASAAAAETSATAANEMRDAVQELHGAIDELRRSIGLQEISRAVADAVASSQTDDATSAPAPVRPAVPTEKKIELEA